jgi:hypothetical protein
MINDKEPFRSPIIPDPTGKSSNDPKIGGRLFPASGKGAPAVRPGPCRYYFAYLPGTAFFFRVFFSEN